MRRSSRLLGILLLCSTAVGLAQPNPTATAKGAAVFDMTGYWVSVVTEDWRYRMVTPAKGDYASVPLNPEGKKMADAWDPAKDDGQCKAYGAPAVMRVPGRLHVTWQGDETLKIETDAGIQTRLFHFTQTNTPGGGLQGVSAASWFAPRAPQAAIGGLQEGIRGGSLKVVTDKLAAGYLRKNGVPYSADTVLTEYFDRVDEEDGTSWLLVQTIVEDPRYLTQPFITSTHFKKQPDATGWRPTPCFVR